MNRKQHIKSNRSKTPDGLVISASQLARLDQSFADYIDGKTFTHQEANDQVSKWLLKSAGVEKR